MSGGADASLDGGDTFERAVRLGALPCETNFDCVGGDPCLTGTCEVDRKRCVYDVCRKRRCTASTCDRTRLACGEQERTHGFPAARFRLGAALACRRCAVAAYPWLFLVTTMGAVALDVSDPSNDSPRQVPIVGLGFVPWALALSDHRLWMIGEPSGSGPSRLPIAMADIPAHPFVTSIPAGGVLASYERSASSLQLFGVGQGGALLLDHDEDRSATALDGLVDEQAPLRASPLPLPPVFEPTAAREKTLLLSAVIDHVASFAVVSEPGSRAPRVGGLVRFGQIGDVSEERSFAQAPDGSVVWLTPMLGPGVVKSMRAYVLRPGHDGAVALSSGVDVETYDAIFQTNEPLLAPGRASAAFVDEDTVMVVSRAAESEHQTAVGFVKKSVPELVREPSGAPLRELLLFPVGAVLATTGSHGVGYVIATDPSGRLNETTIYAFDPGCPR